MATSIVGEVQARVATAETARGVRKAGDPAAARAAIRPVNKIVAAAGVTVGIYGDAGVGKTSLVRTLPADKTLFVDCEGGSDVLAGWDGASLTLAEDLVTTSDRAVSLKDCMALLATIQADEFRFVVLDSVSLLEKRVGDAILAQRGKEYLALGEYGDMGQAVQKYLRAFSNLRWRGINVILIAHATKSLRGEDGVANPLLQAGSAKSFSHLVSVLGYMTVGLNQERSITWARMPGIAAKSRYDGCMSDIEAVPKDSKEYLGTVLRRIWAHRANLIKAGINPEPEAVK